MMPSKGCLLLSLLLTVPAWAEVENLIEYQVTAPEGSFGMVDGKTAYEDWRRGTFDNEPMVEVAAQELPDNLPDPVVIPFAEDELLAAPVGKPVPVKLEGEDRIFVQIGKDEQKARCLLLGQGCEALLEPEKKDSVYFRPIEELQKQAEQDSQLPEELPGQPKRREIIQP